MIRYGTLEGAREPIVEFIRWLSLFGTSGQIAINGKTPTVSTIAINRWVSISTFSSVKFSYTIVGEETATITFEKPYPTVSFGELTKLTVSPARIEFNLRKLPDGFLTVVS